MWETVHIIDGLLHNESEVTPDVVHADTQGQITGVVNQLVTEGQVVDPDDLATISLTF
nr:Tn3 family transposase [Frankia sp. ArI3]